MSYTVKVEALVPKVVHNVLATTAASYGLTVGDYITAMLVQAISQAAAQAEAPAPQSDTDAAVPTA